VTTRQRIALLARAYPRFFPRRELEQLVHAQLGPLDILENWRKFPGVRIRARAPRLIYHICAGNLAVSTFQSIAQGLILGAQNMVKLPGDRDDDSTRREIEQFVRGLPAPLKKLVKTHRVLDEKILRAADAVIAFGSDGTMASLRAQVRWDQKFLGHGHALSLLWIAKPDLLTSTQARACAKDVLTYDQLGCLSPQAIYVPRGANISALGDKLAKALETEWSAIHPKPKRPLSVAARIVEVRDVAHARGHRVWVPAKVHLGWTLIHDPSPALQISPLHGVIYLRQISESRLGTTLAPVRGRISTVGVAGEISSRLEEVFLSLGVSRFCPAGRMQFPHLTWHHDGRPTLGDLVTWSDAEERA